MHPFPLPIYLFSVSGFLIFFIGFYSWRKVKTRESLILFFLATAQFSWAILNFLMLNSCGDNIMVEFWDRLVYIPVIFFAPLLYHFSIEFCKIRTKWQKILLYISYFLAFIFIILSRTDYFVKGVFNYKWGCHTIAQTVHHFWLLFTTIFIMLTFFNILKKIKDKSTPPLLKEQSFYVFLALFFYSLNISAAFPAYKIGIYPIGYLGLPLFTFILYPRLRYYRKESFSPSIGDRYFNCSNINFSFYSFNLP